MTYKRKTFAEKYETHREAEIKETKEGRMVIPAVSDYDDLMKQVPRGSLITTSEIREALANKYKVDYCCPLVTGIFVNIVAGKADEDMHNRGMTTDKITPYWRTLRSGGEVNPKFPGGSEAHAALLEAEGFVLEKDRKGKVRRVQGFEKFLYKF